MNIYTSTKAMPYVYMGIHKTTGEFYIGYRSANVKLGRVSSDDLFIYRTSSKIVRPNFDNYDWYIVAEFYKVDDAYDFEQQLIHENWDNPLLLNKMCHYGKERWRPGAVSEETKRKLSAAARGQKRGPFSKEHKQKISEAKTGKELSAETKQNMSNAGKGRIFSNEHKQRMSMSRKGWEFSAESKQKMSESAKRRVASEATRRKISEAKTGKKRQPHSEETKKKISDSKILSRNKINQAELTLDNV